MARLEVPNACVKDAVRELAYVAVWIALSGGVIIYNKWVLSYSGFPFPVSLTMCHMAFSASLAALMIFAFKLAEPVQLTRTQYVSSIMPIGALFAGTLWLGNAAYLHLSVSFIQMVKAFMPVLVYLVGVQMGTESWQESLLAKLAVITAGVVYASLGEVNFVLMGFLFQAASMMCEATRLTLVQILLTRKGLSLNPITTLYYVAPACFGFLTIPWVVLELPKVLQSDDVRVNPLVLLSNCACAFALNLAVFLLIGKTSALTMNVAGVVKDWMLIGLSWALFGAPVSVQSLVGYGVAFLGVCWYNYYKMLDKQRAGNDVESAQVENSKAHGMLAGVKLLMAFFAVGFGAMVLMDTRMIHATTANTKRAFSTAQSTMFSSSDGNGGVLECQRGVLSKYEFVEHVDFNAVREGELLLPKEIDYGENSCKGNNRLFIPYCDRQEVHCAEDIRHYERRAANNTFRTCWNNQMDKALHDISRNRADRLVRIEEAKQYVRSWKAAEPDRAVEVLVFYGRERYARALAPYLWNMVEPRGVVDKVWLVNSTRDKTDLSFLEELAAMDERFEVVPDSKKGYGFNYYMFSPERSVLMVKIDDDITFILDGSVELLARETLVREDADVVMGNVVNSPLHGAMHTRTRAVVGHPRLCNATELIHPERAMLVPYSTWRNGEVALWNHYSLLKNLRDNTLERYLFNWVDWHGCGDGDTEVSNRRGFNRGHIAVMATLTTRFHSRHKNIYPGGVQDELFYTGTHVRQVGIFGDGIFMHHQLGGQRVSLHPLWESLLNPPYHEMSKCIAVPLKS